MKKSTILATILSAATLTMAGAALAADPVSYTNGGARTLHWTPPAAPSQPILWMPSGSTDPRAHSAAIERPSSSPYSATPPSAIGMEVINARGDTIGVVDRIVGSVVIASTSSFLGFGTHEVALSWPQLRPTESGEAMQLQTTLSNDQLRDLPEFKQ